MEQEQVGKGRWGEDELSYLTSLEVNKKRDDSCFVCQSMT